MAALSAKGRGARGGMKKKRDSSVKRAERKG